MMTIKSSGIGAPCYFKSIAFVLTSLVSLCAVRMLGMHISILWENSLLSNLVLLLNEILLTNSAEGYSYLQTTSKLQSSSVLPNINARPDESMGDFPRAVVYFIFWSLFSQVWQLKKPNLF